MSKLLESGDLQNHIFYTLQPSYAQRYTSMMAAIKHYLVPLGVTLPQTDRKVIGGYFIWFALPVPLEAAEVAMYAEQEENLIIAPGPIFGVYGDEEAVNLKREVRLCFSWEEEDRLVEGIERLGQVMTRLQRSKASDNDGTAHTSGKSSSDLQDYR